MRIEILYSAGCRNHHPALHRLSEALREEGLFADLVEIEVRDPAGARRLGFPGSPTIRVDGKDVEMAARGNPVISMSARTYMDQGHTAGVPPRDWIREAVREASGNGRIRSRAPRAT